MHTNVTASEKVFSVITIVCLPLGRDVPKINAWSTKRRASSPITDSTLFDWETWL
jgi:hypothetical protein